MSDIVYCAAEAADDPRFAYAEDTFNPPPGTWAPDCGHPACIEDDAKDADVGHSWDCAVAECRYGIAHSTCDFEAGHDGDHSYARPPTPEARLVPYEAPTLNVVLIRVMPDDDPRPAPASEDFSIPGADRRNATGVRRRTASRELCHAP